MAHLIIKFILSIRTIAAALVSTRLDYANSILYDIPAKHISRLQRTQHTLARVVRGKRYIDSSPPSILKELHWLPSALSFGTRGFRRPTATIWNSLPANVRSCLTLSTFRRHLKSHLFQSSFPLPSDPSQCL